MNTRCAVGMPPYPIDSSLEGLSPVALAYSSQAAACLAAAAEWYCRCHSENPALLNDALEDVRKPYSSRSAPSPHPSSDLYSTRSLMLPRALPGAVGERESVSSSVILSVVPSPVGLTR